MTANLPSSETSEILISEVGPRDGLQSVKATMPTADKLRWIDALYAAGVREIEGASFVPASPAAAADGRRRRRGAPRHHAARPDGDGAGAQPPGR